MGGTVSGQQNGRKEGRPLARPKRPRFLRVLRRRWYVVVPLVIIGLVLVGLDLGGEFRPTSIITAVDINDGSGLLNGNLTISGGLSVRAGDTFHVAVPVYNSNYPSNPAGNLTCLSGLTVRQAGFSVEGSVPQSGSCVLPEQWVTFYLYFQAPGSSFHGTLTILVNDYEYSAPT